MSETPDRARDEAAGGEAASRPSIFSRFFRRRADPRNAEQPPQPDAAPSRPRAKRREGALSALSGFLTFFVVISIAGLFGLVHVLRELREPGPLTKDKVVFVAPRSDVPEILAQLERDGVIDNSLLMNVALLVEGVRGKLKPGEYLFKPHASLREVMDALVNGRQVMHGVTIPEGLTSEQIVARLRDSDVLAGDVREPPKEGALLPETYKVTRGYPRAKLLAKMQEGQRKLLDRIWANRARDLPVKTPYDLVTLASIVEKETGRADERPRVAAVFVNRLRKGMRLQSDPTIVYGLVGGKATLGRGILRSEVEKWTAYNTYAIDGLPPGPIANPGKAALEAAANPLQTHELYFVADGTGGHAFADTLEQHQRNVLRWRQIEKEQKDKVPGEIDRVEPDTAVNPPQPTRNNRGDAGGAPVGRLLGDVDSTPIGRLVGVDEVRDDYPRGLSFSADHGALKRLGAFLPSIRPDYAGDIDAGLRLAAVRFDADGPARPLFTTALAQLARAEMTFIESLRPVMATATDGLNDEAQIGEDQDAGDGPAATYPLSPKSRAEQKARAAKLGLPPTPDELPNGAVEDRTLARPAGHQSAASASSVRGRALDASEGTALDPLRDKSWDLNSAKSVPNATSYR